MVQIVNARDAVAKVVDGMTIMVGGFLAYGTAEELVDELVLNKIGGLTLITTDTAYPGRGVGKLIDGRLVKKLYASYIGAQPETAKQMYEGFLEVVLVPQGSLAEKIRAGGAGIGGVLTPTGVGTPVAEGKQVIEMDGKQYLLEPALHADVALIRARKADKNGNLVYAGTARNFNPVMATAADYVIALVDEIVENGEIDPDAVHTPGIFVDALVRAEG